MTTPNRKGFSLSAEALTHVSGPDFGQPHSLSFGKVPALLELGLQVPNSFLHRDTKSAMSVVDVVDLLSDEEDDQPKGTRTYESQIASSEQTSSGNPSTSSPTRDAIAANPVDGTTTKLLAISKKARPRRPSHSPQGHFQAKPSVHYLITIKS